MSESVYAGTGVGAEGLVPPPSKGLGSNSNYVLDDDCTDIVGLSVTINVTADIVCQSSNDPTLGCNFQLNAYSDQANSAWQQYVVGLIGAELHGKINNWKYVGGQPPLEPIIDKSYPLIAIPNVQNTIPSGYQITITLSNDDNNNVNGVTWVVINNEGITVANVTQNLLSIPGITEADLAPIVAFEMVLVGPAGGHNVVLSSGAGTFVYSATDAMTVRRSLPHCVVHRNGTAETSNSAYGQLAKGPATPITQTLSVTGQC